MRGSGFAIILVVVMVGVAAGGSGTGPPRGTLLVVAEAARESGGINYPSDVYVVDIDGTHVRNLTHDRAADYWAKWMPDGRRIVFASHASNTERGPWHIFVINSDGTHRRRLTSRIGGTAPGVSPAGRRIAFVVERGRTDDSYVMDADGRHKRRIATKRGVTWYWGPAWSPYGDMLVFLRQTCPPFHDCSNGLFAVNSDGTGLTRLARSPEFSRGRSLNGFEWSPTRRTLAVEYSVGPESTTSDVTIADLRRHGARLVLSPVKTIRQVSPGTFRWAPDGRTIIYNSHAGTWVADARRAGPRRRFPIKYAYVPTLTWSPNGRWVPFSQSRDPTIQVATATGHEQHTVTRKICCLLDELAWAPR